MRCVLGFLIILAARSGPCEGPPDMRMPEPFDPLWIGEFESELSIIAMSGTMLDKGAAVATLLTASESGQLHPELELFSGATITPLQSGAAFSLYGVAVAWDGTQVARHILCFDLRDRTVWKAPYLGDVYGCIPTPAGNTFAWTMDEICIGSSRPRFWDHVIQEPGVAARQVKPVATGGELLWFVRDSEDDQGRHGTHLLTAELNGMVTEVWKSTEFVANGIAPAGNTAGVLLLGRSDWNGHDGPFVALSVDSDGRAVEMPSPSGNELLQLEATAKVAVALTTIGRSEGLNPRRTLLQCFSLGGDAWKVLSANRHKRLWIGDGVIWALRTDGGIDSIRF